MFLNIFIERPRFAFVIAILMVLAGLICLTRLPIAEYPEIAPPTIMVTASYPGASSQVLAETVASVIEEQVNGIEDMTYFKSESDNNGNYTLTLTFKSGINSDIAQVNVQNAVQRAESQLPETVRQIGVTVNKRSTDIVGVYNFKTNGKELSHLQLANYVRMNVKDPFARLPGMGYVEILGARNYSMRIWLDPMKIAALNLAPEIVAAKIASQNTQAAIGTIGGDKSNPYLQLKMDTLGRLSTTKQFEEIVILTTAEGEQVTLGDIARLELGAERYSDNGYFNGEPSVAIAIYRQDGANAIELINSANALLEELKERFPEGVEAFLGYDPTDYIRTNVEEIALTLLLTLLLVIAITYLFMQDWRASLIPAISIPVSLIGTFFFMHILGYSINVLTLFGLILVVGSLVDDAIIVVENTMRLIETEHLTPKKAAIKSLKQITGVVIATTLVTVAIYAPVGFYGGMVGTIYVQFSVTMCISLCLSAVNALTLSPALCSLLLRPVDHNRKKVFFFRWFDTALGSSKSIYIGWSKFLLRRVALTGVMLLIVIGGNYYIFNTLNSGFLPDEDKGGLLCEIELPPGASLMRTEAAMKEFNDKILAIKGIKDVITVSGFSIMSGAGENIGFSIVVLDDWSKRKSRDLSISALRGRVMEVGQTIPEAQVRAFQPPAVMGLGVTGGVTFALRTTGSDTPQQFEQRLYPLLGALNNKELMPGIQYAFSGFNARTPQLYLDIDRRKAEALGVPVSRIFSTLQSNLASLYVNDFNISGYSFKVKIQVDAQNRSTLANLEELMVQNDYGEMVPLTAIAKAEYMIGARKIERFNQNMSAAVTAVTFPGVSSGKTMKEIEGFIKKNFPKDYTLSWTDLSYQERGNEGKIIWLMLLAVVFGYLFLVAQYESWTIPLPVIISVSFATLGGLLGLLWSGMSLDIYAQLGLIMLIGLSVKSAILMVEFSMQERELGKSIARSAVNGADFRYRAILMTAWSFIIGVCPLLFASGAGAESRKVIGATTFWGMIVATLVGIAFIPPMFAFFQKTRETVKKKRHGSKHKA